MLVDPNPHFCSLSFSRSFVFHSGISDDVVRRVGDALIALPEGFKAHRGIERVLKARADSLRSGDGIDWATAEAFAMGSLMLEGNKVRLAGQDVQRGTFSHRHAVVRDQRTGGAHTFLDNVAASESDETHAAVDFCNSPLNEFGVLGALFHGFCLHISFVCSSLFCLLTIQASSWATRWSRPRRL